MKMAYVAAAAFMCALSGSALTSSAFAQAACPAMPAAPAVPDGTTAKAGEMTLASRKFTEWSAAAKASLDCDRAAIEALKSGPNVAAWTDAVAKLKAVQDSPEVKAYSEKVNAYNESANKANTSSTAWQGAVDAYNARGKK
jgi:hypothetical protein